VETTTEGKNIMTSRFTSTRFALVLLAAAALAVSVTIGTVSLSAAADTKGDLHAVKECSQDTGLPGAFCTVTSSNLALIPRGTRIYYMQAAGILPNLFDSTVVLDAGGGNRALGRCTVDPTGAGLCTFSDGTGQFAGFQARLAVSYAGGFDYRWDGTYSIDHDSNRK
jgi:hypothetical protein